jgi:predicted amidophosphoribosyltransferase
LKGAILAQLHLPLASNNHEKGLDLSSTELAQMLRSGPVRSTLDKMMQAAAAAVDIDYMVLGLRHTNKYEFIATYGVPFTAFADQVPANRMGPTLFDREVEVEDLQKEPNFVRLAVVPEAKLWRYGINAPIRLVRPLTDDGVLALSGASRKFRKAGGPGLSQMRRFADILADFIWMTLQTRAAQNYGDVVETVKSILLGSIRHSPLPLAIVDDDLKLIGYSGVFVRSQQLHGGKRPVPGENLGDYWLDAKASEVVRTSMQTGKPVLGFPSRPKGSYAPISFDFHRLSYNDVPSQFGLFGMLPLNDDASDRIIRGENGVAAKLHDSARQMAEGAGPVSRFLDTTLVHRPRLLKRKKQPYLAVRSWRKSIKPQQLEALKALKAECPDSFVELVAADLAETILQTYGRVNHCVVVPMPCGNSGPGCLSCRLGESVARRLDVECIHAFADIPTTGSSHPRKNINRPKMKCLRRVEKHVILIDDVATSGAHIEEACKLLSDACAIWPVVWVAD